MVSSLVAVVKTGLDYDNIIFIYEIDQSMFLVNSSRPTPLEHMSKWFWFANSLGRVTQDVFEKSIHSFQGRHVA